MMKITLNKQVIWNIFVLFPFFELLTFDQLIEIGQNPELWNLILNIYSLLRIIFTLNVFIKGKRYYVSVTFLGLFIFIIIENLVSLLNGSLYINFFVGSFTIIGLVLNCNLMIKKSIINFINACYYLFGFLVVCEVLSIFIWPDGFFNADIKAYAIYFLGSKNTAFFYYFIFLYFLLLRDFINYKKFLYKRIIWIIIFSIASIVSDAMSCFVMLLFIGICYIFLCQKNQIKRLFNIKICIPVIICISVIILIKPLREFFTPILSVLGRDVTFTGRDVLWEQAIDAFIKKPFIGNGIFTSFILETKAIANHAHSHYLDILAKYGIFTFLSFVITILNVMAVYAKNNRNSKKIVALNCIILSVILIHSIADHLMIYNLALLLVSMELVVLKDKKAET